MRKNDTEEKKREKNVEKKKSVSYRGPINRAEKVNPPPLPSPPFPPPFFSPLSSPPFFPPSLHPVQTRASETTLV